MLLWSAYCLLSWEIQFSAASVHLLVSLGLNVSPPDPLRTNEEAPEEGGTDTDCDGSPLPEDSPEVRAVPTGIAEGTALH